jgi:WD40 repeat protein
VRLRRRAVFIILGVGFWFSWCFAQNNANPGKQSSREEEVRLVPQLGHSNLVNSVSFSPDGRFILTGSSDHTAKLWDARTGVEIRTFSGHSYGVEAVAFSPDGRNVLTGSLDDTAKLWDARTGVEIRTFSGHTSQISSATFSPDGRNVLTGSWDDTAKLWDAQTGVEIRTFSGHSSFVMSVAFSPDGGSALTGSEDGTAKLWDIQSGAVIRTFSGHSEGVDSIAFSSDGRFALTGSKDKTAKLWDIQSGAIIRAFSGHSDWITSVSFSPDGGYVLTGSTDNTAKLWEARTGAEIRAFSHPGPVVSVLFSPDGRYVLTVSGTARLWDAQTGTMIRTFSGHSESVFSVSFSPDGRYVLTGLGNMFKASSGNTASLWDAQTGAEIRALSGHLKGINSAAFSHDGRFVLTGSSDKTAKLWDAQTGAEIRTLSGHSEGINSAAFSYDGRFVLTGSYDNTAKLWDAQTGAEIRTFSGHSSNVESVAFSPDGRYVLTGSWDNTAKLWDAWTGAEIRTFSGYSHWIVSVAFSPDGRYVLIGSWDNTAKLWDAQTGVEIRTFSGHSDSVNSVAFSRDGRYVLTGSYDNTAKLWDAQTGAEIRTFSAHSHQVESAAFSPDGRCVLTGSLDGTTRFWDAQTGREICSLISFSDGTWAVVDPEGRFDASNSGDVEGLHWVVGLEAIALSQLKERYYEPGLLAKVLGFNKEPLREVRAFRNIKLFPEVEAQAPAPGTTRLEIDLADRGGGIGKVRVLVNGKEIASDARGSKPDPDAKSAKLTVDLAGAAIIPGQKNKVEIIAWNAEGYLSSRGVTVNWTPSPSTASFNKGLTVIEQTPELYAIIGGISDYASGALRLRYAAKDAQDMAVALEVGAKRLFGAEKVHLTLLAASSDPRAIPPSRTNFVRAFEKARSARPRDILVVYLAGHGVALSGDADVYAYLTQEALSIELADPAVRKAAAITSEELTDWIKRIPALKQVMILDTCAAGAAAAKLVEKRGVSSSQVRAIERLKDRTGFHVLMGSAADAVSYEASQYGQGLLTYALLQGMRGAALREDEYVDVSRLFQYAADQVPQLARNIGGIQRPQIAAPRGASFDVGRLTGEDKSKVPLSMIRPLILRPLLIDPQENDDNLNLSVELRKALEADSYITARQGASDFKAVFVDADELPGAVRPTGTYVAEGKQVRVKLTLKRDGQKIATVEVEGTKDDLAGLAAKIAQAITQALSPGA